MKIQYNILKHYFTKRFFSFSEFITKVFFSLINSENFHIIYLKLLLDLRNHNNIRYTFQFNRYLCVYR